MLHFEPSGSAITNRDSRYMINVHFQSYLRKLHLYVEISRTWTIYARVFKTMSESCLKKQREGPYFSTHVYWHQSASSKSETEHHSFQRKVNFHAANDSGSKNRSGNCAVNQQILCLWWCFSTGNNKALHGWITIHSHHQISYRTPDCSFYLRMDNLLLYECTCEGCSLCINTLDFMLAHTVWLDFLQHRPSHSATCSQILYTLYNLWMEIPYILQISSMAVISCPKIYSENSHPRMRIRRNCECSNPAGLQRQARVGVNETSNPALIAVCCLDITKNINCLLHNSMVIECQL